MAVGQRDLISAITLSGRKNLANDFQHFRGAVSFIPPLYSPSGSRVKPAPLQLQKAIFIALTDLHAQPVQ